MTNDERIELSRFINKVLYEVMTIDDYYMVMDKLGVERKGNRFRSSCHNVIGGGWNLGFDSESRAFYCFSSCGCAYSLLSLVKKVRETRGESHKTVECMAWICETVGIEFNIKIDIKKDQSNIYRWEGLLKYKKENIGKTKILPKYDKSILNQLDKVYHQDWLDYGITKEVMDKYHIRWYEYENSICIPCYDMEGNLIGIRNRNMNTDIDIKYIPLKLLDGTEYKFPTNEVFYGENYNWINCQKTKSVILVEAEKTVLKFESWYGADKNICLGLYGSTLSQQKLKKLLNLGIENFYIALDSDFEVLYNSDYEKFESKVMKIYNMIKPYAKEVWVVYNNMGFENCYKYSITDYTKEQFEQLWENKERIE